MLTEAPNPLRLAEHILFGAASELVGLKPRRREDVQSPPTRVGRLSISFSDASLKMSRSTGFVIEC